MLFNALPVFQFHKGTIRTQQRFLQDDCLINFNSIKVRLERSFRFDEADKR